MDWNNRTSWPATTMTSTGGFLGGGGRLFLCTAFNHALTRRLLLAFRLYVNRPPLAAVDVRQSRSSPSTAVAVADDDDNSCPLSSLHCRMVDHGDGGPAVVGGGKT